MPKPSTKQQQSNAITAQKRGKQSGNSPVFSAIERAGAVRKVLARRGDISQSGVIADFQDRRSTEFSMNSDKDGDNQGESNLNEDIDNNQIDEEDEDRDQFDDLNNNTIHDSNKAKVFKGSDHQAIDEESDQGEEDGDEPEGQEDEAGLHDDDEDEDEEDDDNDDDVDDADDADDDEEDENEVDEDDDISQGEIPRKKGQAGSASAVTQHIKSPPLKAGKKNSRRQIKKTGKRGSLGLKGKQSSSEDRSLRGGLQPSSLQHQQQPSHLSSHGKRCHNQFCKNPFKGDLKRVKIKYTQEYVHLCLKCTERFKLKSYCIYCGQVYYESNEVDGKCWIECGECGYWLHQDCEIENGIKDIEVLIQDDSYNFFCLRCRGKQKLSGSSIGGTQSSINPNSSHLHEKLASSLLKASQQIANYFQSSTPASEKLNGSAYGERQGYSAKGNGKRPYKKQQKSLNLSGSTATTPATIPPHLTNSIQQSQQGSSTNQANNHLSQQQQKQKGKFFMANLKNIKNQIFAPKPDQQYGKAASKYSNGAGAAGESSETYEPKRSKKICHEDSKNIHSPSGTGTPQYPGTQSSYSANSSETYSLQVFLNAKKLQKQKEQQRIQQEQEQLVALRQQYDLSQTEVDLINIGQDEETQFEQQQQPQSHQQRDQHQHHSAQDGQATNAAIISGQNGRQRKDESINFVELPYKKQTVKETTSKKMYYHYSILQELLNPFSLSMSLTQEDINEDLQVYRSIALEGKRNLRFKEDAKNSKKNVKKSDLSPNQSSNTTTTNNNNNIETQKEQPSLLNLNMSKPNTTKTFSSPQLAAIGAGQTSSDAVDQSVAKSSLKVSTQECTSNLSPPRARSNRNSEDCSKSTIQALGSPIMTSN